MATLFILFKLKSFKKLFSLKKLTKKNEKIFKKNEKKKLSK